jgi:GNAT superfamily N-acetyltransferase
VTVRLSLDATDVSAVDVEAFFEGWATRPSPDRILAALRGADEVALAWDDDRLVGFATMITDGALFAYLPLVEVVADRRGEGIGSRLVNDLLERCAERYGVDLCCDDDVVPFYERLGFARVNGMVLRRPEVLP